MLPTRADFRPTCSYFQMRFDFVQFPSQVWQNFRANTPTFWELVMLTARCPDFLCPDWRLETGVALLLSTLLGWMFAACSICSTNGSFRSLLRRLAVKLRGHDLTWVASNPSRLLLSLLPVPIWTYNGRSIKPFRGGLLPPRLVRGMHWIWQCHPRCAECAEAIRWKRWHRVRMDLVWC